MDSRLLEMTQQMMRTLFRLNTEYHSKTCNVKENTIEMTMTNGLIELKAKFPRSLVEDNIEMCEEE